MIAGHEWWLVSRAAGVVALVAVTASTLIGLTLAAGLAGPPERRRALVSFHVHTAVVGLAAIGLHGVALLGDGWLKPGPAGITVPFALDYRPLYTAAGILAGYLAALLGLSFYARKRIGGKRWRHAHRATPVVYVLGLVHTLGAGTDASSTWLRAFLLSSALAASALLIARVRKTKLIRSPRAANISVTPTEI
jgi:sulfoxide reductase heme-binding subunit YedZ